MLIITAPGLTDRELIATRRPNDIRGVLACAVNAIIVTCFDI